MKPKLLHRNPTGFVESVVYQHTVSDQFLTAWHYHPELELVYIVRSSGSLFVGDAIESFGPGSLVLLGSNLPHRWLNDASHQPRSATGHSESLTVHFAPDFLKVNLCKIPEFRQMGQLLEQAKRGIFFYGNCCSKIGAQLLAMDQQDEFKRLLNFLDILRVLSQSSNTRLIASPGYAAQKIESNSRFGRVHAYIMTHFQEDITLEQVADIALMNKSAFCRYFKKVTKKNFSRYLHEIRIGYACKLLSEQQQDISIAEVGFQCGYNNVSNFNRQFKIVTGHSPTAYIRQYEVE
jgi:AraC-like DNA-binding protein